MNDQSVKSPKFYPAKWFVVYLFLGSVLLLISCGHTPPAEHYGFIARLGLDTISVESVTRQGNTLTSEELDRFPQLRVRHTEIELNPDGGIRHLAMDIHTPGEPANQRERKVVADVSTDSVHISKTDGTGTLNRSFATGGSIVEAHIEQMYSLYELYFAAAFRHAATLKSSPGTPVQMRQFYIDRGFDQFPLGRASVKLLEGGKAGITHDWLSGTGEATIDSDYHMLTYSGARTTYKIEVSRLTPPPDVKSIAARFETIESKTGTVKQMSPRDTMRAKIGNAMFTIDYGRPLVRGRKLLGNIVPYDRVWRTGANAATQFTTSATIKIAGMLVPAGAYTLWTVPHASGVDLIVNKETGQWGTEYNDSHDLGTVRMVSGSTTEPMEAFTISIIPGGTMRGTIVMEWGAFRWTGPIEVE